MRLLNSAPRNTNIPWGGGRVGRAVRRIERPGGAGPADEGEEGATRVGLWLARGGMAPGSGRGDRRRRSFPSREARVS